MIGWWWLACRASAPADAQFGPFELRCEPPSCAIQRRGGSEPLGEPVWVFGPPAQAASRLGARSWLLAHSAGDGCPSVYTVLCDGAGGPARSEAFGNCEEPASVDAEAGVITVTFAAGVTAARPAQRVRIDPVSCARLP